ncbi:ubiquitin-like protein ISG15 [Toxotes jaculatrix]|uniref:ubiquitin-like protein ISG15 n=1 Tax=Toxotes jaculatrix TaxID=941984 RepID=UPI001B3AADB9|nr:ubiquitin-like protein ISG15 [Toxotes jaculatrix]
MDIIIIMLGETHRMRVHPQDTVGYLKKVIQEKLGVPTQRQKLAIVNGQRTDLSDDSKSVSYYGLESGSTVSLLVTQPPATIQVFVRNDKGQISTYDIKPDETVSDFKTKVQCREGVAASQQRLVFQGREMNGGKLSDYKVEALSTIDLLLRLRGG